MLIEYHSKLQPEFMINPSKGRRWRIDQPPFEFSVDGVRFVTPSGFWTDFASVPRIIWPVISPYDLGVGPVPHDLGYFTGYKNKAYWDSVFLACMEKDGIADWKTSAAYFAVSWLAGSVWDSYRKRSSQYFLVSEETAAGTQMVVSNWAVLDAERISRKVVGRAAAVTTQEQQWLQQVGKLTHGLEL
jgi:hypothetical protein